MKRLLSLLLIALTLCALAAPAAADVLFEPDDAFYRRHSDECEPENRSYYANGAEGYVLVYSSPTGDAVDALPNDGEAHYVTWTWNGEWAYLPEGWVRLADLALRYDSISFSADHAAEISEADETLTIGAEDTVWAYRYPGSGDAVEQLPRGELYFSALFTDSAGRRWGYFGYYMGIRGYWVCLDDPANGELPPDENAVAPKTGPAADAATMKRALTEAKRPTAYLYAGAACVAVIAAAVITVVVKKRKKA